MWLCIWSGLCSRVRGGAGDGGGERRLCVVEGVGGESGGLERKNRIAPTVAPELPGPLCSFLSEVWKVP